MRGQKVTVLGTRNNLQKRVVMPRSSQSVAHSQSALSAPEFQFYLTVHTEVKIMIAEGFGGQSLSPASPSSMSSHGSFNY